MKLKAITVVLYIILFTNCSIGTQMLDRIAAIVDNDIILESDIIHTKNFNDNKYHNNNSNKEESIKNHLRNNILNQLISDTLIAQLAQHANISINNNQINEIINYIAEQNNMTRTEFLSYLTNKNIDYTNYINYIKKNTIINTISDYEMQQRIKILPYELHTLTQQLLIQNNNTAFEIDHITIPFHKNSKNEQIEKAKQLGIFLIKEMKHGITIQELKTLYFRKQKRPTIKIEKIRWSTLNELPTLFSNNIIKQKIQINTIIGPIRSEIGFHILKIRDIDQDIKHDTITKVHIRHILIKTTDIKNDQNIQTQLLKIIKQIKSKRTTFTIEAQQVSEDDTSSYQGGDLGWKNLEDFENKFQILLTSLKIGEISPPIKTPYGWHLVQLLNTRKINKNEILCQENAYQEIFNQKVKKAMQDWIEELKTLTYIKIYNYES